MSYLKFCLTIIGKFDFHIIRSRLKEIKQFRGGGLDNDSAPEDIAPNDVAGGYNVRFTGTEEGEEGYATDIESNELIDSDRPAGINKAIGAFGFETVRKGYAVIYNSAGYHLLTELDYDTKTEAILFTNKTDSAGIDIMPLDPQFYVNDMKLLQDKFLVFTDSKSEVYYINLERLKSGELRVITKDDIRLIKAPSLITPIANFGDDASRSVNLLKGNLFQFAVQYVYLDDEHSAWSSFSKREVYSEESTPVIGTDVGRANNLIVSVNAGSNRVKKINVGARIGLFDFMLIKSIERTEVIAIENDTFATDDGLFDLYDPSVSGIYEVYNESTNTYSFAFYNDGLYPNIDVLETDLNYDHVPQIAGTLELLNGNVLALGDITEGYERPTVDVSISQTSYDPQIAYEIPVDSTSLKVDTYTQVLIPQAFWYNKVQVFFSGTVQTGDKVTIVTQNQNGIVYNRITTTATVDEDEDTLKFIKKVASELPYPSSVITVGSQVRLTFTMRRISETPDGKTELLKGAPKVTLSLAGTGQSKSIHSIKTNSSYQLALGHKDRYGRYFPIVTDKRFILKTQSLAQLEGLIPRFNWTINNATAPTGAESYQWLISENTTHQSTLYVNAVLDTTNTDEDYLVFKLNTLQKFNENNTSSILAYDYTAGDRCTFVSMQPEAGDKIWFNDPKVVDVEVVEYKVKVTEATETDPAFTDYLLKVRKSSSIDGDNEYNAQTIEGVDILLEIYTPKKRTTTVEGNTTYNSTLFYEIGEEYPIVNGEYSKLTGDIDEADVYYKTRQMVNATDENDLNVYEVEDFNFSDFYQSNYTSYGRARTYEDEKGVKRLKDCIRYSDESRVDSDQNGITRFFTERLYGGGNGQTSANYGAINKLFQRDNYLICIQETKLGHIPVFSHILEDNQGSENVAISDRILGNIRYIQSGTYGMGNAKESFASRQDGTVYFVDPNNSLPIRDGRDGVRPIANKMSKYFKRVIQQARNDGKKIIGYFDNYNDEFITSIEGVGDIVTTIRFDDPVWSFVDTYVVDPATLISTGTLNGSVSINTTTGKSVFTPATDYIGSAGFGFSFLDNGSTVYKNTCLTVEAGDKSVDDFTFVDLSDKELSTSYESNAILVNGNTVASPISITSGEYSINGSAFTSSAGTVVSGDTVVVRATSSSSYSTAVNAVLTIFDKSDTFSVTTKAEVLISIAYTHTNDLDPYVGSALIAVKNGIENFRHFSNIGGTINVNSDTVVQFRQVSFPTTTPWPDNSTGINSATLTVVKDGVTLYTDTATAQVTELHGSNYSFTPVSGSVYSVTSSTTSTMTGYSTEVLQIQNNVSAGGVQVQLNDNTTTELSLLVGASGLPQTGLTAHHFNVLTDANLLTVTLTNTLGVDVEYTVVGESAYSSTGTVLAGDDIVLTDVVKGGLTITFAY